MKKTYSITTTILRGGRAYRNEVGKLILTEDDRGEVFYLNMYMFPDTKLTVKEDPYDAKGIDN